jgi:hypothetical protein
MVVLVTSYDDFENGFIFLMQVVIIFILKSYLFMYLYCIIYYEYEVYYQKDLELQDKSLKY